MIECLQRVIASPPDRPEAAGPDHPIRKVTREIAFEPGAWTKERAAKVTKLFDGMAADWNERISADRPQALRDALARGNVADGCCVEIGSGTGSGTRELVRQFARVIAVDIAREMLAHAPADIGHRVQADAGCLPLDDRSVDAVVLVNAFLFPSEVDRVLRPSGRVLFISTLGEATPIYLSPDDACRAMPGDWQGVSAEAGWGSWCSLWRAR